MLEGGTSRRLRVSSSLSILVFGGVDSQASGGPRVMGRLAFFKGSGD